MVPPPVARAGGVCMYVLMSGVYGICGIDAEIQVCLCTCLLVTVWGIIHMENIYTIRVRYIEPLDRARAVYIYRERESVSKVYREYIHNMLYSICFFSK